MIIMLKPKNTKKKEEINPFAMVAKKVNLFDDEETNDETSNEVEKEKSKIDKEEENIKEKIPTQTKKEKPKIVITENIGDDTTLVEKIKFRNNIIVNNSFKQVNVNEISKDILDRLKDTYGHTIGGIADALIIDYYNKNKKTIESDYRKKMKSNDIF